MKFINLVFLFFLFSLSGCYYTAKITFLDMIPLPKKPALEKLKDLTINNGSSIGTADWTVEYNGIIYSHYRDYLSSAQKLQKMNLSSKTISQVAPSIDEPYELVLLGQIGNYLILDGWNSRNIYSYDMNTDNFTLLGSDLQLVTSISGSTYPATYTFDNHFYYIVTDSTNRYYVHRTDGVTDNMIYSVASKGFHFMGATANFLLMSYETYGSGTLQTSELYGIPVGAAPAVAKIKDLQTGNPREVGYPGFDFAYSNGTYTYFTSYNTSSVASFYYSDGTSGGTNLLRNLAGTNYHFLYPFGTKFIYYETSDSVNFSYYYINGTSMTLIGTAPTRVSMYTSLNSDFFFEGTNSTTGISELWWTNGSSLQKITNIDADGSLANSSSPIQIVGNHFFTIANQGLGNELYQITLPYNTTDPISIVKDINVGTDSGLVLIQKFFNVNGKLFFWAGESLNNIEPWISDGTSAGTTRLVDINPGPDLTSYPLSSNESLLLSSGNLLFYANHFELGIEPWTTDGTTAGTALVADFGTGNSYIPNFLGPPLKISENKTLFFYEDPIYGGEPFVFDTSNSELTLLKDTSPGPYPNYRDDFNYEYNTFLNNRTFAIRDYPFDDSYISLYFTDGTVDGTKKIKGLPKMWFFDYTNSAYPINDHEIILNTTTIESTTDYYRYNFLTETLTAVDSLPGDAGMRYGVEAQNRILYEPLGGGYYITDGSNNAPVAVTYPNTEGQMRCKMSLNNQFIFFGGNNTDGYGLFAIDPLTANTTVVKAFVPTITNPSGTMSVTCTKLNDKIVVFFQESENSKKQLWMSDGTTAGTNAIYNFGAGYFVGSGMISDLSSSNFNFAFSVYKAGNPEYWISDGTTAGTKKIIGSPGVDYAMNYSKITDQYYAYYFSDTTGGNMDLIKFVKISDNSVFTISGDPSHLLSSPFCLVGSKFLFSYQDADHGNELWSSEGTTDSTKLEKDFFPGPASSSPRGLQAGKECLIIDYEGNYKIGMYHFREVN